jgi:selenocysteine lyase/cysteine desulfurase
MKLAARLLFQTCRNALTTDLDWPGYQAILVAECRRVNRMMTVVPVRSGMTEGGIDEDELIRKICTEFTRNNCDGLFLTAVSSDGLRLPAERIVQTLEDTFPVRFVAVDGAQDFCHAGADLRCCDLYLAGAHKWLGAYHPLGIGFYGRRRTTGNIETTLATMTASGDLDDPLLRFSDRLEAGSLAGLAETVSVAPLFSCQGAVDDYLGSLDAAGSLFTERLRRLETTAELAHAEGWRPILPDPAFRSGILLLRPENAPADQLLPGAVRSAFRDRGISLSAYEGGSIRLSIPATPWSRDERDHLQDALRSVATGQC